MQIYITTDSLFQIENKIYPPRSCSLQMQGDNITLKVIQTGVAIVDNVDVKTIVKDTSGNLYASLAAFLTAMKTFFQ